MSAPSIYQDLKYRDSDVYSELEELPRKQQQPPGNGPNLQEVKDLEKKLCFWRIIAITLSLLIISVIILAVAIFFTQCKKEIDNAGLQTLKANISVNNASSCNYCPINWIYHSGNCYFFSIDSLNWTASRDDCRSMSSRLAVIKNIDDETFVEDTGKGRIWIGLSQEQNGPWIWEDGTLLCESFWQPGEPNNKEGFEGCAELFTEASTSAGWNDDACQKPKFRLCQRPAGLRAA